jgi:hypothetical protein
MKTDNRCTLVETAAGRIGRRQMNLAEAALRV